MTPTRIVLVLAATGIAATVFMKKRAVRMPRAGAPLPLTGSSDLSASPRGADSLNGAERLQAKGIADPLAGRTSEDPFRSTSEDGPYARSPGLADFARGA